MMEKVDVNGPNAAPIFQWLRANSDLRGDDLNGNFEKFFLNADGKVLHHWTTKQEVKHIHEIITNPLHASMQSKMWSKYNQGKLI